VPAPPCYCVGAIAASVGDTIGLCTPDNTNLLFLFDLTYADARDVECEALEVLVESSLVFANGSRAPLNASATVVPANCTVLADSIECARASVAGSNLVFAGIVLATTVVDGTALRTTAGVRPAAGGTACQASGPSGPTSTVVCMSAPTTATAPMTTTVPAPTAPAPPPTCALDARCPFEPATADDDCGAVIAGTCSASNVGQCDVSPAGVCDTAACNGTAAPCACDCACRREHLSEPVLNCVFVAPVSLAEAECACTGGRLALEPAAATPARSWCTADGRIVFDAEYTLTDARSRSCAPSAVRVHGVFMTEDRRTLDFEHASFRTPPNVACAVLSGGRELLCGHIAPTRPADGVLFGVRLVFAASAVGANTTFVADVSTTSAGECASTALAPYHVLPATCT